MKMFKKPDYLKPEINDPMYYVHLVILATVVLGILQLWKGGNMLTLMNVIISIPLLLAGDVAAHSILGIN